MSTDNSIDRSTSGSQPEQHGDHSTQGEPGHERGRLILIAAGVILLVVVLIVGILPRIKQKEALAQGVKQAKSSLPLVTVTKPTWVFDPGVSLPGNIEAIKATVINARSTGYLSQLFVDIGSHVTAGQLLGVVQSPDVDQQLYQAQAQTIQSRATVQQSKAGVAQAQATVAQDQAEVARQRFAVQQARQSVAVAEAQLAQSEAAEKGAEAGVAHANQALNVQRAALRQSEAQRDLAKVTNGRYQRLVAMGFDSQQDADTAAASYKVAGSAVESAEAAVSSAIADVATAQETLNSAKAAVKASQANVESMQESVRAAQSELASTQATVAAAQHAVKANQETVSANQAAVGSNLANERRFDVMRGFEKILAPFSGVITARNVDVGTLISAGGSETGVTAPAPQSGILGIARTDVVRIQVNVPQTYVPAIAAGSKSRITVKELPGKVFTGMVSLRAGALDTTSRTQLVEVHIDNPANELVPGMYAEVRIMPIHPARTLHVAGTTLIVDANGTSVAIVNLDNTVHIQKVTVGRDFGAQIEILSGLEGNERLVNTPADTLQDGQKVQILKPAGGGKGAKAGAAAPTADGKSSTNSTSDTQGSGSGSGSPDTHNSGQPAANQTSDAPSVGGGLPATHNAGQSAESGDAGTGVKGDAQPGSAQPANGAPGSGKHGHHKHTPDTSDSGSGPASGTSGN